MEIKLTEEYLEQSLKTASNSLVGRILKRFEIIEDKNIIKAEVKELIYENFRNLRDVLLAFDKGLLEGRTNFSWQFKKSKNPKDFSAPTDGN